MFTITVQSVVLKAFEKSFPLLFIVSSLHNIRKFFFIATQSVPLLQNDPFIIKLGFGLSQTYRKTVQLEISGATLSWLLIIYVFLGSNSFGSKVVV